MSDMRVVMTGPGRGEVFVDGVALPHVTGFSISVKAGELNSATVSFQPRSLEISGPFVIDFDGKQGAG